MRRASTQPRVLVVDDQEDILELLGEYLRTRGLVVHTAYDPSEASSIVEDGECDVVLADLSLDDRSGMALLEQLQAVQGRVATLVMTGFPTVESAVEAMRLGARDYIQKPFRLKRVYEAVQAAAADLARERALARRETWLRFLEESVRVDTADELSRLYGLLASVALADCEATEVAVWVLGRGGWEAVARGGEVHELQATRPEGIGQLELDGERLTMPVRVAGRVVGVVGVAGGRDRSKADSRRVDELARVLGRAMARVGWEDLSERSVVVQRN